MSLGQIIRQFASPGTSPAGIVPFGGKLIHTDYGTDKGYLLSLGGAGRDIEGLWHINELTGDVVKDSSRYGRGGTASGTTIVAGKWGKCRSFNGSSDFIDAIGAVADFSFIQNTGIFTIEVWIKLDDYTADALQVIISNTPTSAEKGFTFQYENRVSQGSQRRLEIAISKGGSFVIVANTQDDVIGDNDWHYLAVTGDGTNIEFYIDGVHYDDESGTTMGTKSSGDSDRILNIGRNPYTTPLGYLDGLIEEVMITSRCKSAAEILAYYNASAPHLILGEEGGAIIASLDLTEPYETCTDGRTVWYIDATNDKIIQIDFAANEIISFSTPGSDPVGLCDFGKYLWHVDFGTDLVYLIDKATGEAITSFATPAATCMGIATNGNILFISCDGDDKIYLVFLDGEEIKSFSSPGSDPRGVAFTGKDLLHTDEGTDMIYYISLN